MSRNLHKELHRRANRTWTRAELSLVRNSAGVLSTTQIAEKLGRSPGAVRNRMYQLGYDLHGQPLNLPERPSELSTQVITVPSSVKVEEEPVTLSLAFDLLKLAYEEGHVIHISISGLAISLQKAP